VQNRCNHTCNHTCELTEDEKSLKFLHGFNHEYNLLRVQILGKENLLPLSKVFFIVREEKTERVFMLKEGISKMGLPS